MNHGSLFSGYLGLDLAAQSVLGGRLAWVSDIDPGACKILAHRFPGIPNLGDITTVDWSQVEPVDVLTGGSPCQDVSAAGKRAGMRSGTRSGLWASMCDAIDYLRPALVVWENVRGVLSAHADSALEPCPICVGDDRDAHLRALGRVVGDLSELGYDTQWTGLRAADVGAPHGRFRVFVLAWPADAGGPTGQQAGPSIPGIGCRTAGQWAPQPRGLRSGSPAADTDRHAVREQPIGLAGSGSETVAGHPCASPAHAEGAERRGAEPEHLAAPRRGATEPGERIGATADTDGSGSEARSGRPRAGDAGRCESLVRSGTDWGIYAPAIRRWERTLGRVAPAPTEPGSKGQPRLSPRFVEWMQGLPAGWVTDVPGLSRNDQLKALGNGVVPQQATAAVRHLLAQLPLQVAS